jgi:hypothetical protein
MINLMKFAYASVRKDLSINYEKHCILQIYGKNGD